MKRATLLYGGEGRDAALETARDVLLEELGDQGMDCKVYDLAGMDITPCMGCFGCWVKSPGLCVIDDRSREITGTVIKSDLLVYLTPVTFGGYSWQLKKAVDRQIPLILPFFQKIKGEIHHVPRYERYPALVAIGSLPGPDEEAEKLFGRLLERNAINFFSPYHASLVLQRDQNMDKVGELVRGVLPAREVVP